jgi:NitT/TauT family transport system substrate-binding protein
MAREYKITPEQAKAAIDNVLGSKGVYWSRGEFDYEGMEFMLKGLHMVKAIPEGPFDWKTVIDESFLPADLRSKQ